MANEPLRIAIVGTGNRSSYLYGPLIQAMKNDTTLVGIWGRSAEKTRAMGENLGVPAYTDLERLIRETGAQLAVVSVNYDANGEVGRMAVEAGLDTLLETPISHRLSEADAIIAAAKEHGVKIEIAEQFHRRPLEQIKLKLIEAGVFGRVHSSFSDFAGHGYHGMSVMRSYLGFNNRPLRVSGSVHEYPLAPHWSRLGGADNTTSETQEHGIVEFEGGQVGIFHWTSIAYDSPMRWWRSSRFLAEKGMGLTTGVGLNLNEQLSVVAPGGQAPHFITVDRRWERVDGGALESIVAHTGLADLPTVTWENPFRPRLQGHGPQWHDDELGVAGCLLSLVQAVRSGGEPSYGPHQARLDQELILALRRSAQQGGKPIQLPLDGAN